MKKKIMALLATLGMAASAGAVEVNENLSINGFVDASYNRTETDNAGETQSLSLDEVEVNFLFNAGGVSGELHVDNGSGVGTSDQDFSIEQVFMSYTLENGLGISIGRYGSALGLERQDATYLNTYSRAYKSGSGYNLGNVDEVNGAGNLIAVYEGVALSYGSDAVAIRASFQNSASESRNLETDDLDLELHVAYTGIENLNLGIGARFDNGASGAGAAAETDVVNLTAVYTAGTTAVGFEYTTLDTAGASEMDGYVVHVDYGVNANLGVALRYSTHEQAAGDYDQITIAPNYQITESLFGILEYSDIEDNGVDSDLIALELTLTF